MWKTLKQPGSWGYSEDDTSLPGFAHNIFCVYSTPQVRSGNYGKNSNGEYISGGHFVNSVQEGYFETWGGGVHNDFPLRPSEIQYAKDKFNIDITSSRLRSETRGVRNLWFSK